MAYGRRLEKGRDPLLEQRLMHQAKARLHRGERHQWMPVVINAGIHAVPSRRATYSPIVSSSWSWLTTGNRRRAWQTVGKTA